MSEGHLPLCQHFPTGWLCETACTWMPPSVDTDSGSDNA